MMNSIEARYHITRPVSVTNYPHTLHRMPRRCKHRVNKTHTEQARSYRAQSVCSLERYSDYTSLQSVLWSLYVYHPH